MVPTYNCKYEIANAGEEGRVTLLIPPFIGLRIVIGGNSYVINSVYEYPEKDNEIEIFLSEE